MRLACILILAALVQVANAQEPLVFSDPEQEERFLKLATELRCLVCQNQTIADSDAPLAQDLRQEIFEMMATGANDQQIKEFMVARYGDFVLYRPPIQSNTIVLWVAPFVLLLIGGVVVARAVRKRSGALDSDEENQS